MKIISTRVTYGTYLMFSIWVSHFSDIYLKTDVLLLAIVFENFRKLTRKYYGLDAACFVTLPSLSFNAALKMSEKKIKLLTDIDQSIV